MKGIVILDTNERLDSPSVNASISRFYKPGDIVEVIDSVAGDEYDADDTWYKLHTGAYVWSGAVDVQLDSKLLPADEEQYLISYRKVKANGRPDVDSKDVPDQLYFAPIKVSAPDESVRVNVLDPVPFVDGVMKSIRKLNDNRKHVLIYIHGWQIFPSLKLDLFSHFVQNYMTHPANNIAKIMFLSWPSHGKRDKVDDRSILAGKAFTANNLFAPLELLSKELAKEGKFLNLLVHSFGHQLLNGMVNPATAFQANIPDKIFENIFLMAADVTHLAATDEGMTIDNFYGYKNLTKVAKRVHVFHNKYDYLLYISTKKSIDRKLMERADTPTARLKLTANHRNLGNYGTSMLPGNELGFNMVDVDALIDEGAPGNSLYFPIKKLKGSSSGTKIEHVWNNSDYDGINGGRVAFRAKKIPNHHRYLFTCRPVIDEILKLSE